MERESNKVVILGGGFGGLYAALSLARSPLYKSGRCQITLVEKNDRFLFTPLLYELITGELQPWEIAPSYQKLLRGTGIDFCHDVVVGLDLGSRHVYLADRPGLAYDYLAIAIGCETRWVNLPGLKEFALTFRSLVDVERLDGHLQQLESSDRDRIRLAVIGGGPNGVELACKLADRLGKRGEVRLIERGADLVGGFPEGVRRACWQALRQRKVAVDVDIALQAVTQDSLTLARGSQTQTDPVDLVVWTAGTQPKQWLSLMGSPLTPDGKLVVLPTLQLPHYPNVLALGDGAVIDRPRPPIPATAQVAYQQGPIAARNLLALMQKKPLKQFHYLHLGDMLTLGVGSAIVSSFGLNLTGPLAAIVRRIAYIFRLPTARHRLQVFRRLFGSWFSALGRVFR